MKWINVTDAKNEIRLENANEIVIEKDKLYLVLYAAGLSRAICDQIVNDLQPYDMRFNTNR